MPSVSFKPYFRTPACQLFCNALLMTISSSSRRHLLSEAGGCIFSVGIKAIILTGLDLQVSQAQQASIAEKPRQYSLQELPFSNVKSMGSRGSVLMLAVRFEEVVSRGAGAAVALFSGAVIREMYRTKILSVKVCHPHHFRCSRLLLPRMSLFMYKLHWSTSDRPTGRSWVLACNRSFDQSLRAAACMLIPCHFNPHQVHC